MSKGIVIGVAESQTFDYIQLAKNFIENIRVVTGIPIFALTNFSTSLPVNYQQLIDYKSSRQRRLVTGYGKLYVDFAINIKLFGLYLFSI